MNWFLLPRRAVGGAIVALSLATSAFAQYSASNFPPLPSNSPVGSEPPTNQPFQSANSFPPSASAPQQAYPPAFQPPTGSGLSPPGTQPSPFGQNVQSLASAAQQDASRLSYLSGPTANAPMQPAPMAAPCGQCQDGSCDNCRFAVGDVPDCQDCPKLGFEAFQLFNTFRGAPDGAGPALQRN